MIKFEFLKLHRKIIIPLIIVISLLLSFIIYKTDFHAENATIENYRPESIRTSMLSFFTLDFSPDRELFQNNLSDEDKLSLNQETQNLFFNFISDEDNIKKGKDIEKEALEFRDRVVRYVEDQKAIIKKYGLKIPEEYAPDFEFGDLELEKMIENGTTLTDEIYGRYSSNPMRALLTLSSKLLGIIPILLLILIFMPIISSEKNSGTILLLETQPLDRYKMIISKQLVIVISSLVYFLSVVVFTLIIGLLMGQKWHNGHLEIYRIFSNTDNLKYIYAYQLLFRIFIRYLVMTIFFSSLIIFLSERSKDYIGGIIVLLTGILILSLTTKTFPNLKSSLNPVYALNYYENILGRIEIKSVNNTISLTYIEGKSLLVYLSYLFLGIFFTFITVIRPKEIKYGKKIKTKKLVRNLGFETKKISSAGSFSKIIISTLLIFFILFLSLYLEDIKKKPIYGTYLTFISEAKLNTIKYNIQDDLNFYKETYGKDSIEYKEREEEIEGEINKAEEFYKKSLKAYDDYKNKDGNSFYEFKYEEILKNEYSFSSYIKGDYFTKPSYEETKALYKEMSKENILPLMVISDPFMSSLEDVDPWKQEYRKDNVYSHSALYLPRRIERTYPIDLLLISLISLISLGAYSYDKENGNQIEFMYTEPVARRKYHWRKILASFLVGLMTLGLILALLFILALATEGLGDPNFPVVKYIRNISPENVVIEAEPYFDLIPLWKYDLRLIGSYIFQIGFLASLGAFISIFVKEKIKVVGMTLGITAIFIYLGRLIQSPLKVLSPFTHMEAARLSNGSQILGIGLKTNNIYISLGVLLAWTLIFGLLGSLIVKKKEVR